MVEQAFFIFLINVERGCRLELFMGGCSERSGSAQNGSNRSCKREAYMYLRGTVPYRTVPKSRVNAASVEGKAVRIKFRQTNSKASGKYCETVCIKISFACCQCCVIAASLLSRQPVLKGILKIASSYFILVIKIEVSQCSCYPAKTARCFVSIANTRMPLSNLLQ